MINCVNIEIIIIIILLLSEQGSVRGSKLKAKHVASSPVAAVILWIKKIDRKSPDSRKYYLRRPSIDNKCDIGQQQKTRTK